MASRSSSTSVVVVLEVGFEVLLVEVFLVDVLVLGVAFDLVLVELVGGEVVGFVRHGSLHSRGALGAGA